MNALLDLAQQPGTLRVAVQPIVEGRRGRTPTLYAVEAFTHGPRGTNLEEPAVFFNYVRLKHAERTIDRTCVSACLSVARELKAVPRYAVNVHASTLSTDADFATFLLATALQNGIDPRRLIVEIVEHSPSHDLDQLVRSLHQLRHAGATIGIDDVGAGYANFEMILECGPSLLKVARGVVHGCADDLARQHVLRSLLDLAPKLDSRLVAEGIERPEDLAWLVAEGVELLQGYSLSRSLSARQFSQLCEPTTASRGQLMARIAARYPTPSGGASAPLVRASVR